MKAILVVSFGTSYKSTREMTIQAIENDIQEIFSEYKIYRAWTSKMIIKKVLRVEGIKIPTVEEAIEEMIKDGVTELIVQPTHIMNGIENDIMKNTILENKYNFSSIKFGDPLLTSQEDMDEVVEIMNQVFEEIDSETAVVMMGHGSEHYANMAYAALDYTFKDKGYKNFFMGTVEAYPSLDEVKKNVVDSGYRKVMLTPFMIVAGDHATNDLLGEEEDSWYNQFKSMGLEVTHMCRGLGEIPSIRNIFVKHIKNAVEDK